MKKLEIKKLAGVGVLSLAFVVGMTGVNTFAQSGTIDTTGPDSTNVVELDTEVDLEYRNDTELDLNNDLEQDAESGDAEVHGNTTGGDAESGSARNTSSVMAEIEVDNTSAASWSGGMGTSAPDFDGTIENTGPDSYNKVEADYEMDVEINNDTNIDIRNDVEQDAESGDAEVRHNTTGGSATSGAVSNTSTSSFTVHVAN